MPGTTVLRTVAGLTDPTALAIFERIVSATPRQPCGQTVPGSARSTLRTSTTSTAACSARSTPSPGTPLRRHPKARPDRRTVPAPPLDQHLRRRRDRPAARREQPDRPRRPRQWADRAAYYQSALLHAHPYREGNGRTVRLFLEDLADGAGHTLDWTRSSHERNNLVAIAAAHGDYEPARALLTVVAGGSTGIDRPITVLNDLDKYLHGQAWRAPA